MADDDALAREFLLRDFEHWVSCYEKNEAAGESRLAIFTGLITAVGGGVAVLGTTGDGDFVWSRVSGIAAIAATGLLVVGLLTLLRVRRRNRVTTGYIQAIKAIRKEVIRDPALHEAITSGTRLGDRSFWNGGLLHVVMVLNLALALAVGASLASLVPGASTGAIVGAGAALAVSVLVAQVAVVAWRDTTDAGATKPTSG